MRTFCSRELLKRRKIDEKTLDFFLICWRIKVLIRFTTVADNWIRNHPLLFCNLSSVPAQLREKRWLSHICSGSVTRRSFVFPSLTCWRRFAYPLRTLLKNNICLFQANSLNTLWKVTSRSTGQYIPRLLRIWKFITVPISLPSYFFKLYFNIILHLCLGISRSSMFLY